MDWSNLVPALIGLVGVLVGLVVTERAKLRRETVGTARRAALGLTRWSRAVQYMAAAPERVARSGDKADLFLAVEMRALGRELDVTWWDDHGVRLAAAATHADEWSSLSHAGDVAQMLLTRIHAIGDAGETALRKLAKAETIRRRAPSRPDEAPDEPMDLDVPDDEWEAREARRSARFEAEMAAFDAESKALFAEIDARLDHRLMMVEDLRTDIVAAQGAIELASAACTRLIARNQGLLGRGRFRRRARERRQAGP